MADDELKNLRFELGREMQQYANLMNELRVRLNAVRLTIQERETVTKSGVYISDHAVLRYLERYKHIDMHAVREEIVAMANRAGIQEENTYYARRKDEQSGITMGINEITKTVTTVYTENEQSVFPDKTNHGIVS